MNILEYVPLVEGVINVKSSLQNYARLRLYFEVSASEVRVGFETYFGCFGLRKIWEDLNMILGRKPEI